jgi:DNA gyrase/topoisomerase IV subunit A
MDYREKLEKQNENLKNKIKELERIIDDLKWNNQIYREEINSHKHVNHQEILIKKWMEKIQHGAKNG